MMESIGAYQFEIKSHDIPGYGEFENKWVKGYYYVIYDKDSSKLIVEANEYFDNENVCRYAAIGHITFLEQGES